MKNFDTKALIVFLLGWASIFFLTNALDTVGSINNAINRVQTIFVTSDGLSPTSGNLLAALNRSGNGEFIIRSGSLEIDLKDVFDYNSGTQTKTDQIDRQGDFFEWSTNKYYLYSGDENNYGQINASLVSGSSFTGAYPCYTGMLSTSSNGSMGYKQFNVAGGLTNPYRKRLSCNCVESGTALNGVTGLDNKRYLSCAWTNDYSYPVYRDRTWQGFIVKQKYLYTEADTAAIDNTKGGCIAGASTNYTSYNILTQAGVSALAQANAMPQSVLSLLQ